jgi:hypothetical protein
MHMQPVRKTARLAKLSLVFGILSFGLFLFACLSLIWIKHSHFNEYKAILLVGWAFILILGSIILALPGLVIAIIVLARIRRVRSDNKTLRTAIIGFMFSSVGPAFVLIYLAFALLFNSSPHPPVTITPSSISPLPPG